MKKKQLLQIFLKFLLTQLTILIMVEELNRIVKYSFTDFNYQIQGPYLIKSSMIPTTQSCHQFYDPSQDLVTSFGQSYTHDEYMEQIAQKTLKHNQSLQVTMGVLTFLLGLIIQLVGFISESETLVIIDNLFTLLLPHYTLYINTVSWGDQCVGDSDIFNVLDYTIMGLIPYITLACVVGLMVLLLLLVGCQVDRNNPFVFMYALLVSIFSLYLITIDMISFYCSPQLVLILFWCKFAVMGILLCSMYKVF